jgi:hypothetical protein
MIHRFITTTKLKRSNYTYSLRLVIEDVLGWGTATETGGKRPICPYSDNPCSLVLFFPIQIQKLTADAAPPSPTPGCSFTLGPRPSSPGAVPTSLRTAPNLNAGEEEEAGPRAKKKRRGRE